MSHADANDLALNRLSYTNDSLDPMLPNFIAAGGCGTAPNYTPCYADNTLFANLVNQLGGALAPALLAPAGTMGYNHLYIGYETSFSTINGEQDYWRRGTEGSRGSWIGSGTSIRRDRVPGGLFASRLHVRKGLPMGIELGLQGTYLHDSSMLALGADIRWAPFEGFRDGVFGYLPDLAIRGAVNTLAGNSQMYLTVVSADVTLSKQFTIGPVQLTPYVGGQFLMIFGDSTVLDGTPGRSGYQECTRRETVFLTAMDGTRYSELRCASGTATPMNAANDSLNDLVFIPARIFRWRGVFGARVRWSMFTITLEVTPDLSGPGFLNPDDVANLGRPTQDGRQQNPTFDDFRQFSASLGLGITF